jgi:hypothetical protein
MKEELVNSDLRPVVCSLFYGYWIKYNPTNLRYGNTKTTVKDISGMSLHHETRNGEEYVGSCALCSVYSMDVGISLGTEHID